MGLFTNPEKEENKLQEFMEKYELTGFSQQDYEMMKRIVNNINFANMFVTSKTTMRDEVVAEYRFHAAVVEQNWIMIKQLNKISQQLDKLLENK